MFNQWIYRFNLWRYRKQLYKKSPGLTRWLFYTGAAFLLILTLYVVYLDFVVRTQFEGKRWALPARVYARPLELYPGEKLTPSQLTSELSSLGYRVNNNPSRSGSYARKGDYFKVVSRAFKFWDGDEPSLPLQIQFSGDTIVDLKNSQDDSPIDLVRLDPLLIGSIYPAHNEDRILVKLEDVPPLLVKALLAVEDRDFYLHHGIKVKSIFRALLANLRAGGAVQGGSTLTQQLVKNFFLSNRRTLWRKFNEAIMALLLEWHYKKNEILEAYLNEIYLGQDGKRSIHGFGLASRYYFERPLNELRPDQIALLVALVKGASYYDPRKHVLRAQKRRNLVLDILAKQGDLNAEVAEKGEQETLGVTENPVSGVTPYPAFLDLVRRQLRRDYREEDLTSEGLQIFTTLDPFVQHEADRALSERVAKLEKSRGLPPNTLQGASIVASVNGAEVLAIVGDRNPRFAGFNRAIGAVRPVGSLIKPAIYLTALENPKRYTLITELDDGPLSLTMDSGKVWQPMNYSKEFHGMVPLHTALAHSYNLSTARLGLDIGIPEVINTLHGLGISRDMDAYPSLLLGAVALSPLEVTQMYHTLANGGFRAQLRSIRAVLTVEGQPLQRYALSINQVFDSASIFLVDTALQEAVRKGTGRSLYQVLPDSLNVAGKTGTTDDLRDSWFAGFTSDRLAVVWLGVDDNRPSGLTGASGALRVWGDIIKAIGAQPGTLVQPENIEMVWIDPKTNLRADSACEGAVQLPFILGSSPQDWSPCVSALHKMFNFFKGNSK